MFLRFVYIIILLFLTPKVNATEVTQVTTQNSPTTDKAPVTIPEYVIVVDPGHGGISQKPYELYGDKFDPVSGKYLEPFKGGAVYKKRTESEIVLALAIETKKILDLTRTESGFKEFAAYAAKFSDTPLKRIKFKTHLTRNDSYIDESYRGKDDKNRKYRLYDFPDFKTGKQKKGRISFINHLQPYLVLSLHLNPSFKGHPGGMAAVLSPSYRTFDLLKRISEKKADKSQFEKTEWSNWMIFKDGWNRLENAIADAWIYFNGYWPNKKGDKTDNDEFEGYRYNMVDWRYRDNDWQEKIKKGGRGPYAVNHSEFVAENSFWDREKSTPELWRREDGPELFGGDNHYAAAELMRFVQYGVRKQLPMVNNEYIPMGPINKAYISTYSMPTFINAISAYLEIGYIDQKQDMKYIIKKRREVAISLAVGIYSLFEGLEIRNDNRIPYIPKGKKLDFARYEKYNEGNYFKIVSEIPKKTEKLSGN